MPTFNFYDARGNLITNGQEVDVNDVSVMEVRMEIIGRYNSLNLLAYDESTGARLDVGTDWKVNPGYVIYEDGSTHDMPAPEALGEGIGWGKVARISLAGIAPGTVVRFEAVEAVFSNQDSYEGQRRTFTLVVGGGSEGDEGETEGPGSETGGGTEDGEGEESGGGEAVGDAGEDEATTPEEQPQPEDEMPPDDKPADELPDPAEAEAPESDPSLSLELSEGARPAPGDPASADEWSSDASDANTPLPEAGTGATEDLGSGNGGEGVDDTTSESRAGLSLGELTGAQLSALGQLYKLEGGSVGVVEAAPMEHSGAYGMELTGVPYFWAFLVTLLAGAAPFGIVRRAGAFAWARHAKSRLAM